MDLCQVKMELNVENKRSLGEGCGMGGAGGGVGGFGKLFENMHVGERAGVRGTEQTWMGQGLVVSPFSSQGSVMLMCQSAEMRWILLVAPHATSQTLSLALPCPLCRL